MQKRLPLLGALAAAILCIYGGRHQSSLLLLGLFVGLSTSPFLGLMLIGRSSWLARAAAISCLIIYALVDFDILNLKLGFAYLMFPFISWIAIGVDRAIAK